MVLPGPSVRASSHRAQHVERRGAAEAEALLLDQIVEHRQPILVLDAVGFIDDDAFEIGGDAALADAFGDRGPFGFQFAVLVPIVERRAARIGDADDDVLVARLQRHRHAAQRAAGTDRADEAIDLAIGVAPDFRRRWCRYGLGGWRCCRTGWPRWRRWVRSCFAPRRCAWRPWDSGSRWRRARRPPPPIRRRARSPRPSFPGSACAASPRSRDSPWPRRSAPSPMPVLPAVPSTMTPPGRSCPFASASCTIASAARSFTDWPGLRNSALPRIVQPVSSDARLSLISGVLPMASRTEV